METLASCQGSKEKGNGFMYFYYGDWRKISSLAFGVLAPALHGIEGIIVSVEMFNESESMGKLSF